MSAFLHLLPGRAFEAVSRICALGFPSLETWVWLEGPVLQGRRPWFGVSSFCWEPGQLSRPDSAHEALGQPEVEEGHRGKGRGPPGPPELGLLS